MQYLILFILYRWLADPTLVNKLTIVTQGTLGVKKIPVVPVPDRPYYFFNTIDRATLFSPGGCGLLPKWRLLSDFSSIKLLMYNSFFVNTQESFQRMHEIQKDIFKSY